MAGSFYSVCRWFLQIWQGPSLLTHPTSSAVTAERKRKGVGGDANQLPCASFVRTPMRPSPSASLGMIRDPQAEGHTARPQPACCRETPHLRWPLLVHCALLLIPSSPCSSRMPPFLTPAAFQCFSSPLGCTDAAGLVSPTSSSALSQRSGNVSPAALILVLPDKPAEELQCDMKLSLHWHCCCFPAELKVEIINISIDLATDTIEVKEVTCHHPKIYGGATMHLQACSQAVALSRWPAGHTPAGNTPCCLPTRSNCHLSLAPHRGPLQQAPGVMARGRSGGWMAAEPGE